MPDFTVRDYGTDTSGRFWAKVERSDGCWLWTAAKNQKGYGKFALDGSWVLAHRWAWISQHGPIPVGLTIDHLCRTPACVNVDHMELVTRSVNSARSRGAAAANRRKTSCPWGHEYTDENTYRRPGQWNARRCRTCMREGRR